MSTLPCKYSYTNRPCRRRGLCGGRLELYQQSREENKHMPAGQRARAGPAVNTRICLGWRPSTSTWARAGHAWARKGMNTEYSYWIQPITCGWMVQISNLHIFFFFAEKTTHLIVIVDSVILWLYWSRPHVTYSSVLCAQCCALCPYAICKFNSVIRNLESNQSARDKGVKSSR